MEPQMDIFNWLSIIWSWSDLFLKYLFKFSALVSVVSVAVLWIYLKYGRKK